MNALCYSRRLLFGQILVVMIALASLGQCNDRPKAQAPKQPQPSVEAAIGDSGLEIRVTIPPNFHAYLDAGKDGNFIPLKFEWGDIDARHQPKAKVSPKGEYDEEGGVQVLRGTARFVFELPDADVFKGKTIGVRTQICDDSTGICYRPSTKDVTIQ